MVCRSQTRTCEDGDRICRPQRARLGFHELDSISYRPLKAGILARLSAHGLRFDQRPYGACPYVALLKCCDAYLSTLGHQFVKKLAKQEKQLMVNHMFEVKFLEDPDSVRKGMRAFFHLQVTVALLCVHSRLLYRPRLQSAFTQIAARRDCPTSCNVSPTTTVAIDASQEQCEPSNSREKSRSVAII